MVLVSAGLTSLSLLLVRHTIQSQVADEIYSDLRNSVSTFQSFQRERESTLSHSADLLADLPNLRALMTTHDEITIQDGSAALWQLAGSDLFVLADSSGKVVALHTNAQGFTRAMAEASKAMHKDKELVLRVLQKKLRINERTILEPGYVTEIKVMEPKLEIKSQVLQTMIDEVGKVNPRASDTKPQDLIDRRYLAEMETSGFFNQLWAEKR